MKILSIETSTMLGGVAVLDSSNGLIAETRLNVKTTHSERLMTVIDFTLSQSEISVDDIDVFAAATGPGSFTGLRIGLSTAKGLAYATGKPLVAVPTLDAFAWNFPFCLLPVCLMLDARKSEVYAALFRWEGDGFRKERSEISVRPEQLLRGITEKVLFAGEGALLYSDLILDLMGDRAAFAPADKMVPSPANVAALGLAKARTSDHEDVARAVPLYIRKSEAEVKWSEKR